MLTLKQCIPTYQERFCAVLKNVRTFCTRSGAPLLDLGCGEGEYAFRLSEQYAVTAIDANNDDITYCRFIKRTRTRAPIEFLCKNALNTGFQEGSFEYIVCVDVIEHIPDRERLIGEIARVLSPGGRLVMSFPSKNYPFTYDPLNFILDRLKRKPLPLGAYGYGHDHLVDPEEVEELLSAHGFTLLRKVKLTSYLAGFVEMYWASILQRLLKQNAANKVTGNTQHNGRSRATIAIRRTGVLLLWPFIGMLALLFKLVNLLDRLCCFKTKASVGMLLVAEKNGQ